MTFSHATPAHNTFPLTRQALDSLSLTPEFSYPDPINARELNNRLRPPLPVYSPGELTAVGLIGKIYLRVIDLYLTNTAPGALKSLDQKLADVFDPAASDASFQLILDHFPTTLTHYSPDSSMEYLLSFSGSSAKRHGLYKSFLLIFLADSNPALLKKDNLFTDPKMRLDSRYPSLRSLVFDHFSNQPSLNSGGSSLIDFLIEPSRLHPDSLYDQLDFIRQNWPAALDDDFLIALLNALDRIQEERVRYPIGNTAPQDPLGHSLASNSSPADLIRFSPDLDWMPNVILLAKNVFVWLDQLSREYQTSIYQLDHIPDQELEKLSSWGITGLWLIGLWQRSSASQKIKQICGNHDAVPSAYSLYDYSIADSLGGDEAYQDLSQRAARYNIRLAADMVPNHMGIYSKWIIEHPEWFLSVDQSPYPGYSFQGPNLSEDDRVGIYIEDHYYNKTDAAVVFKRYDHHTGSEKYIYHGNDGTSMPWNDTAQLDFLNPDVREAVIQKILYVARKFPIIRFDAAMTLAKKHIQRLWFPEPGSGGAIPTRSDYSLSKKEFDHLVPEEFWREVVDRVAEEAPDTLLLAEAFWMMEGFFVRSLGMHRVYNSAFMHMLRDEDNDKYRGLIIKTLEYDPQILKRYVNFMNNPDEETAIAQYGSDGKYFGVCVLMSTLPGLPMFGHGQIEGYSEKYGMEYQRAYYNEEPNQGLVERHRREIFPLLHKRYLFAEVDNFTFFDFTDDFRHTNEDVFVFTNRYASESALIVYHNKWGDASGSIHYSVSINGETSRLVESLGFSEAAGDFLIFRDQITDLEYLRPLSDFSLRGLQLNLGAYDYRVYMDFSAVTDRDGKYSRLYDSIQDSGVQSLDTIMADLEFAPLAEKISVIFSVISSMTEKEQPSLSALDVKLNSEIYELNGSLFKIITDPDQLLADFPKSTLARLHHLFENYHSVFVTESLPFRFALALWAVLCEVYSFQLIPNIAQLSRVLAKQAYFRDAFTTDEHLEFINYLDIINILSPQFANAGVEFDQLIQIWFNPDHSNFLLGLSEYNDIIWFNKESFVKLLDLSISYFLIANNTIAYFSPDSDFPALLVNFRNEILDRMEKSNYQVDIFHKSLSQLEKEWNFPEAKSKL
jgi:glycosidase